MLCVFVLSFYYYYYYLYFICAGNSSDKQNYGKNPNTRSMSKKQLEIFLDKITEENNEIKNENKKLKNNTTRLQQEKEESLKELEIVENKNKELEKCLNEDIEKIKKLEKFFNEHIEKIKELEEDQEMLVGGLNPDHVSRKLQDENTVTKICLHQQTYLIEKLNKENSSLTERLHTEQQHITQIQQEKDEFKNQLADEKRKVLDLDEHLRTTENDGKKLRQEMDELINSFKQNQSLLEESELVNRNYQDELEQKTKTVDELNSQIMKLLKNYLKEKEIRGNLASLS